ncbi:MAG: ComEA family DNA-binding protein [Gemmatimonadota bacterium]
MPELNRVERRALYVTASLIVLGTGLRLGLFSPASSSEWRPAPGGAAGSGGGLERTRRAVREGIARVERASRPLAPGERIDPNTAPVEELERLPGIGPVRARAIASARAAGARFAVPADLERVAGLGEAIVARLLPFLTLNPGDVPPPSGGGELLDVNRANRADLEQLTGLGPTKAARIVEYRARHGHFRALTDLLEVPGIGPATLEALRGQLVVK